MAPLGSDLRNRLERTVVEARSVAEAGARAALEAFAVGHHEPFGHMTAEQRKLRTQLRARARQLGDQQDKSGRLELTHIAHECAYEHWHRMLFARFLAENGLLIEPDTGVAISLDECKELAKDAGTDLWSLTGCYAQVMLPQIFRPDDPLLQIALAKEHQLRLDEKLDSLPLDIFATRDALGWCYQFWQSEEKVRVNKSGVKIRSEELPAVTQLFTEDYMVDFMLDNTLGAWWAWKQLVVINKQLAVAKTEEECRRLVALPGCPWKYLRFVKDELAGWRPAAGTFDGWPKTAKELKCIDPCCGSGHFIVAMFERLVAMRMAEEALTASDACDEVIRRNLFGLEIDERCTQIAAFALALAAWRYPRAGGHRKLPTVNIACAGISVGGTKEQWLKMLADRGSPNLRFFFGQLYDLFKQAPTLGSLINPTRFLGSGMLDEKAMGNLLSTLDDVLATDPLSRPDEHEMGVAAQGVAHAAQLLAAQYSLVATNVPYLARGKQGEVLKEHLETYYPLGKGDLATAFVLRCLEFTQKDGTATLVTPQNWFFLGTYRGIREMLLQNLHWDMLARLGTGAFTTISGEVVNVTLLTLTRRIGSDNDAFAGVDVGSVAAPEDKADGLFGHPVVLCSVKRQLGNPDARVSISDIEQGTLLNEVAQGLHGQGTFDGPCFIACFWEVLDFEHTWIRQQTTPVERTASDFGATQAFRWEDGKGLLWQLMELKRMEGYTTGKWRAGLQIRDKWGVAVSGMGRLFVTQYLGQGFDINVAVLHPKMKDDLVAVHAFCESGEFEEKVRQIDQNLKVSCNTLAKVPFDLARWRKAATAKYPNGLPKPYSDNPTQWIANGTITNSAAPLQVAIALMLGYQWPDQDKAEVVRSKTDIDEDGVVCIPSVRGEEPAAEHLRRVLAKAFGKAWTPMKERELIVATGSSSSDLEEWVRDDFFQQHCELFHHRPFIWHIWDGRKRDGFHVLVNYHKLADGAKGRKVLEKLTHAYLNDWIARQRDGVKRGEGGAEERLAAADELKARLEAIIEGKPPYDIFVRWKPLHQQSIGWEPDLNDGVRINIRPFLAADLAVGKAGAGVLRWKPNIKWDKDRGKEPKRPISEFPWFWGWDGSVDYVGAPLSGFTGERWNDCHYTLQCKRRSRESASMNRLPKEITK